MGFFDVVKTVASGGLNKVAEKTSKTKVGSTLNKVLNPVTQAKAVAKAGQTVGTKVTQGAKILHLPSIAATLDFKKAVTNPKGYIQDVGKGYAGDIAFAGQVYSRFKSGDIKGLATQAGRETVQALGGSKGLQNKVGAAAGTIGAVVAKAKGINPPPPLVTPPLSQLTAEPPLPMPDQTTPMDYTPPPPAPVEQGPASTKRKLLLVGGLAAAVLVLFLVMRAA